MEDLSFEESWNSFGYESDEKCCVCGKLKTKTEPRFGYSVCKEHHKLSPIEISEIAKYSRHI